ncbi:hypothetical protein [Moraxella lacunata]
MRITKIKTSITVFFILIFLPEIINHILNIITYKIFHIKLP